MSSFIKDRNGNLILGRTHLLQLRTNVLAATSTEYAFYNTGNPMTWDFPTKDGLFVESAFVIGTLQDSVYNPAQKPINHLALSFDLIGADGNPITFGGGTVGSAPAGITNIKFADSPRITDKCGQINIDTQGVYGVEIPTLGATFDALGAGSNYSLFVILGLKIYNLKNL
jgi:hypothetical protein